MVGMRIARAVASVAGVALAVLWASTPAHAAVYICSQGYFYDVQISTTTYGGVSGQYTASSEDLANGNAHILQELEAKQFNTNSCIVPGGCWVQDGFLRGTIAFGGTSSGDQSTPQVYWETSNPYWYTNSVRQGLSGINTVTFFNHYATGTTDGYGHWNWASYATKVSPWNPVLLGVSPMLSTSQQMTSGLEVYANVQQTCPSPHLSTYDQLQNAPYPANTWTYWTTPVTFSPVAPSPPYYYVRYHDYWTFQTNGAY